MIDIGAIKSAVGGRFGTLSKAAFAIGTKQKPDGTWDFDQTAEVLINPSELRITASTQTRKEEGAANEATSKSQNADGKITPKGITEQMVDMKLIFNVVEAYEEKIKGGNARALLSAATSMVSGLVGDAGLLDSTEGALNDLINKTDFTGFSLLNPDLCCYTPLLMAAHKQAPVIFYWGNLIYAGLITKFQTTFNYFSNQGAPLGAEVLLSLLSGVDDEQRVSMSTQKLLGLVQEGGRMIREPPG